MGNARTEFKRLVDLQGSSLRRLSYDELVRLDEPVQSVTIKGRNGSINTIIEPLPDDRVRVVVQGFFALRFLPSIKAVALDGFYKDHAGNLSQMEPREFWAYD